VYLGPPTEVAGAGHDVSLDPFRGYATALSTSLPHAVGVLDAFHVVRLGLAAVDDVRRRVQQQTLGRRGHRDDSLYRGRRLLRRTFMTLNQRQWTKLESTLVLGDPTGRLTQAWIVAQELMLLYQRARDLLDAQHRLWKIQDRCARSEVPELLRLARTLDAWRPELLAAFTPTGRCPASNGPTEAVNMLIKKIKRIGHGFRNLTNYRASGCCSQSVWTGAPCTGRLRQPPRSQAAHHAWWRRARFCHRRCLVLRRGHPARPSACHELWLRKNGSFNPWGQLTLVFSAGAPE